MVAAAEPNGRSVTFVVDVRGTDHRVTLVCDDDGGDSVVRLKTLGHNWWRVPLVAWCRTNFGPGTLDCDSDGSLHFRWVPRSGRV